MARSSMRGRWKHAAAVRLRAGLADGSCALKSQHLEEIVKPPSLTFAPVHQDRQSDVLHYVQRGNQVVELVNQPDLPPAEK